MPVSNFNLQLSIPGVPQVPDSHVALIYAGSSFGAVGVVPLGIGTGVLIDVPVRQSNGLVVAFQGVPWFGVSSYGPGIYYGGPGLTGAGNAGTFVMATKTGAPVDADFAMPVDGMIVVDTLADDTWFRAGGNWFSMLSSSSLVTSVSNTDGTLTISPTTGAVIASLNLVHANTWTALQTFGNNISLGGAKLNVTSLTSGNILQYNGTNWVNVAVAGGTLIGSTQSATPFLTALGYGAGGITTVGGTPTTTGIDNTLIGYQTGNALTTGTDVTAVGYQAAMANTASFTTAFGSGALVANSTGTENSAFGYLALQLNTTGANNSAFGYQTLNQNTTGSYNTAFGRAALYSNTTSISNSAFGFSALFSNTTGFHNSAFGLQAGYTSVPGNANTTGANNSYFGYKAGSGISNVTALNYSGAIGSEAVVFDSNVVVIGSIAGTNLATETVGIATPGGLMLGYSAASGVAPVATIAGVYTIGGTPTLGGTLNLNGSILSGTATYTGLQTYGNNISFGGAQLNVPSLTLGNVLQYDGTNWVDAFAGVVGPFSFVNQTASLAATAIYTPATNQLMDIVGEVVVTAGSGSIVVTLTTTEADGGTIGVYASASITALNSAGGLSFDFLFQNNTTFQKAATAITLAVAVTGTVTYTIRGAVRRCG